MIRARIFITGDVIGVGFRGWVVNNAQKLNISGYVKNVFDPKKGVEAVLEGEKDKIEEMVKLCKKGPEVSWVENVEVTWEEATGEYDGFIIR